MPSMPSHNQSKAPDSEQIKGTIQLGRVSHQPWRKNLHFVSPSYRAKAFWGLSGAACIVYLWSVIQAFLVADVSGLDGVDKFSLNYSMVFTIFIGLLLAGLCLVICFQGMSLRVVEGESEEDSSEGDKSEGGGFDGKSGRLELRQSRKKPRYFYFSTYNFTRIMSNESTSENRTSMNPSANNYPNALKNNSHTAVISFKDATLSLDSQDLEALEALKHLLDSSKPT